MTFEVILYFMRNKIEFEFFKSLEFLYSYRKFEKGNLISENLVLKGIDGFAILNMILDKLNLLF